MVSLYYCICSLLFLTIFTGISCQKLTPVKNEEYSLEGSTVTLSYNYSQTAAGGDHFFWYRQYPGKPPEFLLSISGYTTSAETLKSDTRFSTKLAEGKRRVDLEISSAAVTDSALYYCAVDIIRPYTGEVVVLEGNPVTLSCNYSSGNTFQCDQFYWYRQDPGKPPQFLISHSGTGSLILEADPNSGLSFKVTKEETQMDLEISSAAVTDSALYYCAVQPTVTGNPESLYKNLTRN
ncbi:uncharacterized protein LOC144542163 [Centroberyx gerrardi]